jgi:hypothetical protein
LEEDFEEQHEHSGKNGPVKDGLSVRPENLRGSDKNGPGICSTRGWRKNYRNLA